MEKDNNIEKTKSNLSWGQMIIVVGVLFLFLYALVSRVNFESANKEPIKLEGFTFVGSEIKNYNGNYTDLTLPTSYSLGKVEEYYEGVITFNNRNQANNFWQQYYAVGVDGYYEFYEQMYKQSYPWVYEYKIGKPVYVVGEDVQLTSMAWGFCSNNQHLESLRIPAQFKTTGIRAFEHCTNLKSVYFEDGVEVVGDGIFDGCINLKEVRLSETTTRIDAYAFFNTGIEKITIPKSVTNFHIGTFYGCDQLEVVTIKSTQIKANHSDYYKHFGNCPLRVIYVPAEALNYYRNTEPWYHYYSLYQGIY